MEINIYYTNYHYHTGGEIGEYMDDNNVIKITAQQFRTPEVATLFDIFANDSLYQGRLVQLNDVEFLCSEIYLYV